MSNSEAPVAPEFAPATAGSHTSGSAAPSGSGGSGLGVDDAERNQKIGAWVEAGATSVPAMLIAIASAAAGGVALAIRRRRGR